MNNRASTVYRTMYVHVFIFCSSTCMVKYISKFTLYRLTVFGFWLSNFTHVTNNNSHNFTCRFETWWNDIIYVKIQYIGDGNNVLYVSIQHVAFNKCEIMWKHNKGTNTELTTTTGLRIPLNSREERFLNLSSYCENRIISCLNKLYYQENVLFCLT